MIRSIFFGVLFFVSTIQAQIIKKVEPAFWWVGMEYHEVELMIYGKNIADYKPSVKNSLVSLVSVEKSENKNYLFLNLDFFNAKPGVFEINFSKKGLLNDISINYELKARKQDSKHRKGFDSSDAIYLITPDRFANGNLKNDIDDNLHEKKIDRNDDYARHGGDIRGIINNLDYVDDLGFTAIWPCPLLENNMYEQSYHGYAMTDFYGVDSRFGTMDEYIELSQKMQEKGLKLIMDQVVNHCGLEHWWMKDLPFNDWVNFQDIFVSGKEVPFSNHRRTSNQDNYAAQTDKKLMTKGWFTQKMPDLNQENPFLAKYLIQNSIWWIEQLGLSGIRQDTYPYPNKKFMSNWAGAIMTEYPDFSIVGEEWSYNPLLVGYWQDGTKNKDGYESNLTSTMDFPMQKNIVDALNEKETWNSGLVKIYEGLANDFAYTNPLDIMVFPDNHDMSRIFTQLKGDVVKTKMALGYLLTLPRIPQIYYGTEILMNDFAKPGDHGLVRTDFPGGWKGDTINAFTGEGLSVDQKEMQNYLQKLLNYRKTSKAIHSGKTVHFAPENGVYILCRKFKEETVVLILNKNENSVVLDLDRFKEIDLEGKTLYDPISDESFIWKNELILHTQGIKIFTNKIK